METEKKILIGIIVAIIIVAIALAAVLVAEQTETERSYSRVRFVGGEDRTYISGATTYDEESEPYVPPALPKYQEEPEWTTPSCPGCLSKILILDKGQIDDYYERADFIITGSKCYYDAANFQEVTYHTDLIGEKSVQGLIPNEDYTVFSGFIVAKLYDDRGRKYYYEEIPVTVDLVSGEILKCGKGHFNPERFI